MDERQRPRCKGGTLALQRPVRSSCLLSAFSPTILDVHVIQPA